MNGPEEETKGVEEEIKEQRKENQELMTHIHYLGEKLYEAEVNIEGLQKNLKQKNASLKLLHEEYNDLKDQLAAEKNSTSKAEKQRRRQQQQQQQKQRRMENNNEDGWFLLYNENQALRTRVMRLQLELNRTQSRHRQQQQVVMKDRATQTLLQVVNEDEGEEWVKAPQQQRDPFAEKRAGNSVAALVKAKQALQVTERPQVTHQASQTDESLFLL